MSDNTRNFKSLTQFRKTADRMGLRIKKVSVSKKSTYYQAISKADGIVGYFLEERNARGIFVGTGVGHIDNAF